MNFRTLILTAPLAAVLACGGSSSSTAGTGTAALTAATPSFSHLAIDQTAADTAAPGTPALSALVVESGSAQMMGPGGVCHPHLFIREREVVERVNRHVYKVLGRIEKLVAANPLKSADDSKTWTTTENGVTSEFTIRLVSPNVYDWRFAAGPAAPAGSTAPVSLKLIMTGEIDRNKAVGDHDGTGEMHIDFASFHDAFPNEKVAQGTLDVQFAVSATSRTIAAKATGIVWELDASRFDGGMIPSGLTQPRSGEYVYFREPGTGGSLKIKDDMVFACTMDPVTANTSLLPAASQMVSRWYKAADGTIHGRSDGLITGGSLPTGISIVGVTCHDASAEQRLPLEGFWLMKVENALSTPPGATVVGFSSTSVADPTAAAAPCDEKFGTVPTLVDATKDFAGWPTSYYSDYPAKPEPFPLFPE
jgi:hypothetical protein